MTPFCHCEERSDEAIQEPPRALDRFAGLSRRLK